MLSRSWRIGVAHFHQTFSSLGLPQFPSSIDLLPRLAYGFSKHGVALAAFADGFKSWQAWAMRLCIHSHFMYRHPVVWPAPCIVGITPSHKFSLPTIMSKSTRLKMGWSFGEPRQDFSCQRFICARSQQKPSGPACPLPRSQQVRWCAMVPRSGRPS